MATSINVPRYFIDCGGHNSCSARIFRKLYDPKCKTHIYSFEIEPTFWPYYKSIPNHTLIKKAVWIENGEMEFYKDSEKRKAGGSLIKKTGEHRHKTKPIMVETIDISVWLIENFSRVDSIDLKMDIEGAEYQVIPRMIETGAFAVISRFMIEWHWYKIGMPEEEHKEVFTSVPASQLKWPGVENAEKILGKKYWKK